MLKPAKHKYVKDKKEKQLKLFIPILVFIICAGTINHTKGQDPIFSQFYANPLYLNPALAGSEKCSRFVMNYRNQPYPAFGTFSSYSFSADLYTESIGGGIGIQFLHDSQGGLLDHTQAGLIYSYHGRLSREWYVGFGMQTTYLNHKLNWNNLVFPDQYNPGGNSNITTSEISPDNLNSHNIDFSAGILIFNERFYGGVSVHHLAQPTIHFFENEKLPVKYTVHLGYEFSPLGRNARKTSQDRLTVSPNLIIQSQGDFHRINYGLYANISPVTMGVWFRQSFTYPGSLIFMAGLKQVNYTIAYSYDHSLSGYSGVGGGAHELSVLLNLNCLEQITKYRIINCPSF